jgi:hypothetical protein
MERKRIFVIILASICFVFFSRALWWHVAKEKSPEGGYFAMCLIVKDETDAIPEWIEYHKRMGASKIYLYDHNSTVPIIHFIRNYVTSGLVDYKYADFAGSRYPPQISAYKECLMKHGMKHKFMAFIDSDEFIVVVDPTKKIPDILQNYEEYGGVSLNWMLFGSSGHVVKPLGGVIANYNKCTKNIHVKAIVNTKNTPNNIQNPHCFNYKGTKHYSVDTNFVKVDGPFNRNKQHAFEIMYINHYNMKSMAEYVDKVRRGRGAMRNPSKYGTAYFNNSAIILVRSFNYRPCDLMKWRRICVSVYLSNSLVGNVFFVIF